MHLYFENSDEGEPGHPVPVVFPEVYDEPQPDAGLEIEPVLDMLLCGCHSTQAIGERALCLAFLMQGCVGRPRTLRELGAFMGCSHVAARARLNRFKASFAEDFARMLNKDPVGNDNDDSRET